MGALTGAAASTVAFAAALSIAPALGGTISPRTIGAALLVAGLSVVYGRAIARWVVQPVDADWRGGFVLIAGFAAVSLVHLVATALLDLDVRAALAADVAGAVVLARPAFAAGRVEALPGSGRVLADAAAVVAIGCLVAAWTRETIFAVATADTSGVFTAFLDYFYHAAEITHLRHYPVFDGGSLYLAGSPQPLYHRASYAMAAVYSALGDVPSLETATRFWLPAGLLLCAIGLYSFGVALAGRLGGVAAVAAVFLLPDASTFGFHNRFLSFHWLVQMAAGSGYAIALVLAGLATIASADRGRHLRVCAVAMGLTLAGAAFRLQVGVLGGGMVALIALSAWRPVVTPRTIATAVVALAAVLVGVLVGLMWLESVYLAPHFLSQTAHPVLFMASIHSQASALPTPYSGWTDQHGDIWKVTIGYAMFVVAAFGHLAVALAIAGATGRLRLGWRVTVIPAALLIAHIGVLLLMPTPAHGDLTDFGHRSTVLIYAVVGALVGAAGAAALATWSRRTGGSDRLAWAAVALAAVAGSATPLVMGAAIQQRWVPQYATIPIAPGAWAAARFVRAQAGAGDTVLTASLDPLATTVAVSERQAWASRAPLYTAPRALSAAIFAERTAAHEALENTIQSFEQLRAFGRYFGVAWYVADTDRTRNWPEPVRRHCAHCGPVAVYDLR